MENLGIINIEKFLYFNFTTSLVKRIFRNMTMSYRDLCPPIGNSLSVFEDINDRSESLWQLEMKKFLHVSSTSMQI